MIVRMNIKSNNIEVFLTAQSIEDCEFIRNFSKEITRLQAHYFFTQEVIYSCEGDTFCFRLKNLLQDKKELLREIENLLKEVSDEMPKMWVK